MSEGNGELTK